MYWFLINTEEVGLPWSKAWQQFSFFLQINLKNSDNFEIKRLKKHSLTIDAGPENLFSHQISASALFNHCVEMSWEWDAWWDAGNLEGRRRCEISQSCQRWTEPSHQNRTFTKKKTKKNSPYFSPAVGIFQHLPAGNKPRLQIQPGITGLMLHGCKFIWASSEQKFPFLNITGVVPVHHSCPNPSES